MSTRFYAGALSYGMGRRWDDGPEPQRAPTMPPCRAAPKLPAAPPTAPRDASPPADRAPRFGTDAARR